MKRDVRRSRKQELFSVLNCLFLSSIIVVVVRYRGMTVREMGILRTEMRNAGAEFKVTKNRIARLALKETPYERLTSLFADQTAIAYSNDPISAARIAVRYAQNNDKLVIIGGSLGTTTLSIEDIKALAELPSLVQLREKLVRVIQTPPTHLVNMLKEPSRRLATILHSLK